MIRIWNYNKSRTHSSRGVKDISLYLNDVIVFKGEIRKAPGTLSLGDQHFEIIAFTNDMNLEQDWINRISVMPEVHPEERPGTGNLNTTTRPTTSAKVANLQKEIKQARMLEQRVQEQRVIPGDSIHTKMLVLKILRPWGDQPFAGLTAIEFNDKLKFKIKAEPSDLNSVHGHPKDKRVISNLINGNNITTDENDMWMIQFLGNRAHTIIITFDTMVNITYLRIWNYNRSPEDAFKGVQFMQILNGDQFIGNVFLRRAPGTATHDYSQVITFPIKEFTLDQVESVGRPIEGVMHPIGFELEIDILSTHGDIHYVGLNGMQVLDYKGNIIQGVVGTDMTLDERVVQNLLTGDTKEESKMWLVPFTNRYFEHQEQRVNRVYFSSQSAFCLGMILFWNYSKTPSRGTYEIMISMDGYVIYKGYLRQTMTAVPFTRSMPQYAKDFYSETKGQEPRFRNEEKFTQKASYAQLERPQTKVKS